MRARASSSATSDIASGRCSGGRASARAERHDENYLRSDPTRPCSGRSSWRGGGNLFFGPTGDAGLGFTKPPSERGIGFCGSSLSYAGGDFTFGAPGPPAPQIFPGVFLESIGFGVGSSPRGSTGARG